MEFLNELVAGFSSIEPSVIEFTYEDFLNYLRGLFNMYDLFI